MCVEIAVVATMFALGNILFGHFEEGTAKWRRVLKFVLCLGLAVTISYFFGRKWVFIFFGAMLIFPLYIHLWILPKKYGINGWTGEPRDKYYELRGWKH